ncbi:MAG: hypothetical protein AAF492_33495, partial [Verrucomicrobiota bacterium]
MTETKPVDLEERETRKRKRVERYGIFMVGFVLVSYLYLKVGESNGFWVMPEADMISQMASKLKPDKFHLFQVVLDDKSQLTPTQIICDSKGNMLFISSKKMNVWTKTANLDHLPVHRNILY